MYYRFKTKDGYSYIKVDSIIMVEKLFLGGTKITLMSGEKIIVEDKAIWHDDGSITFSIE